MNWRKWKLGLFVALLTGLATAFGVGAIVPAMTWKEGTLVCLASIAKDVLLFLKQHPPETVSFDTTTTTKPCNQPETKV